MNSKSAFRNTFKMMNSERPVFIPFVYSLAAKLAQLSLEEMTSDASYYTHSLEDAFELFQYDGIINNFDSSIETALCGCELEWPDDHAPPKVTGCPQMEPDNVIPESNNRIQVLLETTKRITMSRGKDVAVIGILTGPCSLVKALTGVNNNEIGSMIPKAGSLLVKLVKSLCELRVDAVFFREDLLDNAYCDELLAYRKTYADVYGTLFNLVRYYNCSPVIIVKNMMLDFISELYEMMRPGGLVLLGKKVSPDEMTYLHELFGSLKIALGLPLPVENPEQSESQFAVVSQFVNNHKPSGFFYVSEGEIPYDTPSEVFHNLIAKVKNA
jgi:hypothetical protein